MNTELLNWINAASGVATFGTLVFVLIKEYRTRRQVQDLTVVTSELAEQNKLTKHQLKAQFLPVWKVDHIDVQSNSIRIILTNSGQLAIQTNLYVTDKNFKVKKSDIPEVPSDSKIEIFFSKNPEVNMWEYKEKFRFFITYSDTFSNRYESVFTMNNK
jgi:hypothetical protein